MPIDTVKIQDLNSTTVSYNAAFLAELLNESYPDMDVSPGSVLYQLLILPASVFHTYNDNNIQTVLNGQSLVQIQANPSSVSPEVVDNLLSNYMVYRQPATSASGRLVIAMTTPAVTPISPNTVFTSSTGIQFVPISPYLGVVNEEAIVSAQDQLVVQIGTNQYGFIISVTSVDPGTASISSGVTFTANPAIPGVTAIYAESDFEGGSALETNVSMVSRVQSGIAAKSNADRASIKGLLFSSIPQTTDISVIGNGNAEMRRDKYNIFGISTGGKVDVYVRSAALPVISSITKNAVLISAATKTFQVSFSRFENPGMYQVVSITNPASLAILGTLDIVSDIRGVDLTSRVGDDVVPVIQNAVDGVYSAYQTVTVRFNDPSQNVTGLTEGVSTAPYSFSIQGMPSIDTAQTLLGSRNHRAPAGDFLAKAPIPCFVSVSANILYRSESGTPVASDIVAAIVDAVNGVDFSVDRLSSSLIVDAIYPFLTKQGSVSMPVDLRGIIRAPDGVNIYLSSSDALVVPDIPSLSLSRRTVAFYVTPDSVQVNLIPAATYIS